VILSWLSAVNGSAALLPVGFESVKFTHRAGYLMWDFQASGVIHEY